MATYYDAIGQPEEGPIAASWKRTFATYRAESDVLSSINQFSLNSQHWDKDRSPINWATKRNHCVGGLCAVCKEEFFCHMQSYSINSSMRSSGKQPHSAQRPPPAVRQLLVQGHRQENWLNKNVFDVWRNWSSRGKLCHRAVPNKCESLSCFCPLSCNVLCLGSPYLAQLGRISWAVRTTPAETGMTFFFFLLFLKH